MPERPRECPCCGKELDWSRPSRLVRCQGSCKFSVFLPDDETEQVILMVRASARTECPANRTLWVQHAGHWVKFICSDPDYGPDPFEGSLKDL